ncbi:MAG: DUF3795 domain-containing protein [Bacillota bacterium]
MDYKQLTAPCGMDCFNCEIFADNITDEMRMRIAPYLNKDPKDFHCQGCRISGCLLIPGECATKKCVESKGHEFCSDCDLFPCGKLQPCSDQANRLPHNYKLFNLCRIKAIGIDGWVKEAKSIRETYYHGKMAIGAGPSLKNKE